MNGPKGNMVVSFKYFDSKEIEAYKSFFEVNGVQVVYPSQNESGITHVIYKRVLYSNDSFAAIVSGLCVLNHSYIKDCMKANKILTNFFNYELMSNNFYQAKPLSEELAAIVGVREASEGVVGKKLEAYIKKNKLNDLKNTNMFRCDEKLKRIFSFDRCNQVFYYLGILMHLYKYNHILH